MSQKLIMKLFGFCRYRFENAYEDKFPDVDCELCALYVKSAYKGNGVGKKIINYVMNDFKEKGYKKMILWCFKDNYPARMFYEKMYVIRPQSFIPIITLLRTASMNSLQYKKQMIEMKNTNIDISNFEDNMNKFKDAFSRNYMLASRKFNEAIEEIDKSMDHLQKIKDALVSSDRNLRLANDKANDLTIKKLVSKNKTMARKFADETGDEELEKLAQKLEKKAIQNDDIN